MKIVEIFSSIEGEGGMMGRSTVFVRLFGCNLRCPWCDTKHSYDPNIGFVEKSIEEIVEEVAKIPSEIISVTGGEPFIHDDLGALCEKLIELKRFVKIETNGKVWKEIEKLVYIVVSPKPPLYTIDKTIANRANELKFVVDDALNEEVISRDEFRDIYDRGIVPTLQLESNSRLSLKKALALQKELLKNGIKTRVLPQLHKLLDMA